MRWFKRIAAGLLGLVLLLAVVGLLMPSAWEVSRSRVIDASPETIHAAVADWSRWPEWSPFDKEDPDIVFTIDGPATGVGAKRSWTSPQMGDGSQTITSSDPARGMTFVLEMDGMQLEGEFVYEVVEGGTRVTWTDRGDMGANPFMRLMAPALEGMLGDSFERGLENLAGIVTR